MGETNVEWVADGGGIVEEVLRDDAEVDTRGGTLTCGLGDGGTELRSGGIVVSILVVLLAVGSKGEKGGWNKAGRCGGGIRSADGAGYIR